jgi:hypothetical protein
VEAPAFMPGRMFTKRLLQEKGCTAVAVEADWPEAYRVNRYVRGVSDDAESVEALANFQRFPTWMWRNADVLDETRAVEPLERTATWENGEALETFPSGL